MVGAVSARIWTDQVTNKEFQWLGANQNSTTTGNWGLTDFRCIDAKRGSANFVITQQDASWINFEIMNTGGTPVTLDKLHFAASRSSSTTAPTQITITLEQNGTFANPPVLVPAPGSPTVARKHHQSESSSTAWTGYELRLFHYFVGLTLAAGEKATFRIANNAGTARIYLDNFAISGSVGGGTPPNNNFASWIGGFDLGWLNRFRRRSRQGWTCERHRVLFGTIPANSHPVCFPACMNAGAGTFTFTHPINENPASDVLPPIAGRRICANFYYSGQSDAVETTVTFTPGTPSGGMGHCDREITGTHTDKIFVDIKVRHD